MSLYLYAGSFDPLTLGHEWVIQNAPRPLVVVVADNPAKRYRFDLQQRLLQVVNATARLDQVAVTSIGNEYLVSAAVRLGANFIVRGCRSVADYEAERAYCDVNRTISNLPLHLLMLPPPELASVSSSVVKQLVGPVGWEQVVARYVNPHVLEQLR